MQARAGVVQRGVWWGLAALLIPIVPLLAACSDDEHTVAVPVARFSTFQPASVVIGQQNFAGFQADLGTPPPTARTIHSPLGKAAFHDGQLFVADSANNRMLVFNGIPAQNFPAAALAIGQPDLVSEGIAVSQTGYAFPASATKIGNRLYVSDANSRVLVYDSVPTASGAAADAVLGDTVFNSAATGCTAAEMNTVVGIHASGGRLIAADGGNNRVLIWNTAPSATATPADIVLGQNSFGTCVANDRDQDGASEGPRAHTLWSPQDVWSDGTRLVVVDAMNHRVLIWNTFPSSNFAPADLVVGQPDFRSNSPGAGDAGFDNPTTVTSDGTQLVVVDLNNNRVLIWNRFPLVNGQAADVVLGQSNFTNVTGNDDNQDGTPDATPTARTLSQPVGVTLHGRHLILSELANNRYLVFEGQY